MALYILYEDEETLRRNIDVPLWMFPLISDYLFRIHDIGILILEFGILIRILESAKQTRDVATRSI